MPKTTIQRAMAHRALVPIQKRPLVVTAAGRNMGIFGLSTAKTGQYPSHAIRARVFGRSLFWLGQGAGGGWQPGSRFRDWRIPA
jgi:hypothetical protein